MELLLGNIKTNYISDLYELLVREATPKCSIRQAEKRFVRFSQYCCVTSGFTRSPCIDGNDEFSSIAMSNIYYDKHAVRLQYVHMNAKSSLNDVFRKGALVPGRKNAEDFLK